MKWFKHAEQTGNQAKTDRFLVFCGRHIYLKPKRPRVNGKVERSHRIDEEEFYRMLKGVIIDDTEI